MWLGHWPWPRLSCAPRGSVRALATTPLAPLVGAKRANLCLQWGEQRSCLGAQWPRPTQAGRWSGGAVSSRAAGVEPGNGLPLRTGSRLSGPPCQLGGRLPQAPSFLGGHVGELPAAVPGPQSRAGPSVPPTEAAAGQAKWTGGGGGGGRTPASPLLSPSLLQLAAQK